MTAIFLVFGLFSVAFINAMEQKYETASVIVGSGEKQIKTYDIKGADTFIFDGRKCHEGGVAGCSKMQLKIAQIIDENIQEQLTIHADDNIFSYFVLNRKKKSVSLSLYAPDQKIKPSQDIIISLMLKNYKEIVTHGCINAFFSTPIKTDIFTIKATGDAVVHLPVVEAKKIECEAIDNSSIKNQENKTLIADLISLMRKDAAHMALHIEAQLLQAEHDGQGSIELSGTVHEQKLYLKNGSFLALNLDTQVIRPIIRVGKGDIEITGLDWIEGTMALKTKHDVTYKTYYDSLCMKPEEDLLEQYSKLREKYSDEDILKYIVWEYWKNKPHC